ncbi:MAG TPA: nitrate reductase [Acidimicrobiales bacterium]|nr:nitrate reductase [Acidimicrobiales bacterium]
MLRRRHGPRTDELARTAGGFGLGQVPRRLAPERTTRIVCGFCSTGCSLDVHLVDGEAVNLTPTVEHPVNLGMACPKGWESLAPMEAPDRATTPMVRRRRGDPLEPVSWAEAIDMFVARMKQVQAQHGPESVAFLSTGQLPSEEMALLGALGRFGMGIRHCDGNTRQCMATAVVAYKQAFGFDAPPYTYADLEESDVIVLVGSNLAITHPIMWERIARNPHDPEIVVLDPRRTETAVAATQHHALAPKSDLELLYGVAHLLLQWGAIDEGFIDEHTTGFEGFAEHLRAFTPERAAAASGLPVADVERLARTIAGGERVSFWWTMGVNQSHQGVRTAQAIIDLALMTGSIGRPGTGANSITGQCNAMGSRLFSNTTGLLGGHDFTDPAHRSKVAGALGIDERHIPATGGWAYDQIIEGIASGDIRGLWVVATNTAHSWINSSEARDLLGRLDFLVVQDLYADTETAAHADLVLPAAGWGEKEGTFINSERRLGVVKQVRRAPGRALADFWIFKLVAEAWGCGGLFERWTSPEATFRLLAELTEGRPCDISGIRSYQQIDEARGIQWPFPAGTTDVEPERRLFADGRFPTPDGRARFVFDVPRPLPEPTDDRYPLALLTGRGSSAQWHTQTRTRRSEILRSLAPTRLLVELSPSDAAAAGVAAGDEVVVESRRGAIRATAQPTPTVPDGQVFLPMHEPGTNVLTHPRVDPHSRQPAYKHAAVRVRPLHRWER